MKKSLAQLSFNPFSWWFRICTYTSDEPRVTQNTGYPHLILDPILETGKPPRRRQWNWIFSRSASLIIFQSASQKIQKSRVFLVPESTTTLRIDRTDWKNWQIGSGFWHSTSYWCLFGRIFISILRRVWYEHGTVWFQSSRSNKHFCWYTQSINN